MKKYIYIGGFGFIGAVLRYFIKTNANFSYFVFFPLDTFAINIAGSFALALIFALAPGEGRHRTVLRIGITAGFLGAFTTFSTLCRELDTLLRSGSYAAAACYALLSVGIGIASAFLGDWTGRILRERHSADGNGAE